METLLLFLVEHHVSENTLYDVAKTLHVVISFVILPKGSKVRAQHENISSINQSCRATFLYDVSIS